MVKIVDDESRLHSLTAFNRGRRSVNNYALVLEVLPDVPIQLVNTGIIRTIANDYLLIYVDTMTS
jgi:hypothetical protein